MHFDVVVIGSGGGAKITRPAANLGFKVAVIEEGPLGGTCLNRGCIPSKMLIHPADVAATIGEAHRFEIDVNKPSVRFDELIQRVSGVIDSESESIPPIYDKHPNITLFRQHARFLSDNTIDVGGQEISFDKCFVVTGCRAHIPDIPGLAGTPFWTYKEALRPTSQPKSLIVIGGGYIGVELGYFYGALGTDTTFLVRNNMISFEDEDVQTAFTASFSKRFPVHLGVSIESVSYENNLFSVLAVFPDGKQQLFKAEALLVATGVQPNTDKLGLENTSVKTNSKGFVEVDDLLKTNVPTIWAFGDVIGRHLFRHTANYEGEYVFSQVFEKKQGSITYPPVPHAIFSNPQVAGVGMTESSARESGIDFVVGKNAYKDSAMGMALRSEDGFCKLLFDKGSKKLIGAHIVGPEASTMIHMAIAYMKMGATLSDMLDTIYIHPALPEIIRNAVRKAKIEMDKS